MLYQILISLFLYYFLSMANANGHWLLATRMLIVCCRPFSSFPSCVIPEVRSVILKIPCSHHRRRPFVCPHKILFGNFHVLVETFGCFFQLLEAFTSYLLIPTATNQTSSETPQQSKIGEEFFLTEH